MKRCRAEFPRIGVIWRTALGVGGRSPSHSSLFRFAVSVILPSMGFVLRLLLNAAALYLLTQVYSGVSFEPGSGLGSALIAALVMGIVNALIRPVLLLLSLPVNVLTLGLFTLVVNGVVLWLVAALTPLNVLGLGAAIVGALVLGLISWALDGAANMLGLDGRRA